MSLQVPRIKKIPYEVRIHGKVLRDPYFWLRDRENPEVIAYLHAENAYTDKMMEETKGVQEKLYQEMLARIKETDLSVPVKIGDFYYYTRTEKGKQYAIHCRKPDSLDNAEEIILDQNVLAEGHSYFRLGFAKVSPDHQLLAYGTDTSGAEMFSVFFKDLKTGRLLDDKIENVYPSFEWAQDNQTVFYVRLDEAKRPYQLYRHTLGRPKDALVFHEKDEAFFLGVYKTKDRKFLVLDLASKTTSENHVLDAARPESGWKCVHPREKDLEYSVEHHGDDFYIVTNYGAKNFRVMKAPDANPSKASWKEVIPARADVKVEGVDMFQDYWVVYERKDGLMQIRIFEFAGGKNSYLDFPEPVYTVHAGSNPDFKSHTLRFEYTSLVTPSSVFDYDMKTGKRELKKQQEVLGGYNASEYISERIWAVSHDGVKVPISLVYKKGFKKDGSQPLFLYGYGAYGISIDPAFSSTRLSLLNRGFCFAIAHIRGGGDLGRPWYEDGKFHKKPNSFKDFIAAAEHLVREKYTSPDRLVIYGGSAGGLLMGAVTNMRPDLFAGVIAKVPFVDVVNTMLDPSLPLTVTEYEEWGNPEEAAYFETIYGYSPYDHVEAKAYPHLLITGGLNDPRVAYWEPAKWTAKLRELTKSPEKLLLLRMEMDAGHGGPSGRYEAIKEIAFDYAFVFKILGLSL